MEDLAAISYWHWLILALALMILELLSFTAILLWASTAACITALFSYLMPTSSWQQQSLCFALSTVLLLLVTRGWIKQREQRQQPTLNRRADTLVGQIHVLEEAIVKGYGHVNIHDTLWQLQGPDAPAGSKIKVTAVEDSVLQVELVD